MTIKLALRIGIAILSQQILQRPERITPPVGDVAKCDVLRKSVTRDVLLRDRVPGAVFDGDARLLADRFEPHFDFGRLFRPECRLPPLERKTFPGLPDRNATDLELLAACERREETSARTGLKCQPAVAARRDREKTARLPPRSDFLGERFEGAHRIGGHPQSDADARRHVFFFSRCAFFSR